MLTSKEAADALITNLSGWDWKINNDKFVIDQSTGNKLIEEYNRLKAENEELKKRIDANKLLGGVI